MLCNTNRVGEWSSRKFGKIPRAFLIDWGGVGERSQVSQDSPGGTFRRTTAFTAVGEKGYC